MKKRVKAKPKKKLLSKKKVKKSALVKKKSRKTKQRSVRRAVSLIAHLLNKRKKAFHPIIYSKNGRKLVEKPTKKHVLHYLHKHSKRLLKGFKRVKKT